MKLSFENLVDSKLAVIPLYPIEPWNDKKEIPEDKRSARAARDAFKEVKLELRANPAAADSLKYGSYFKVFDQGTPEQCVVGGMTLNGHGLAWETLPDRYEQQRFVIYWKVRRSMTSRTTCVPMT